MDVEWSLPTRSGSSSNSGVITRGLIIAKPWIGKILRGEKTWEVRSAHTHVRGPIALIEKGSGLIVGVASISDSIGPLGFEDIFDNEVKHRVGPEIYTRDDYKWNHVWVLNQVSPVSKPVKYRHKSGAVIWVELDSGARDELNSQLSGKTTECDLSQVPIAKDGSWFGRENCCRKGYYTVGEKGCEQRFTDYQAALDYLRSMQTAKWRRPNAKGNWGIVSAVVWSDPQPTPFFRDS